MTRICTVDVVAEQAPRQGHTRHPSMLRLFKEMGVMGDANKQSRYMSQDIMGYHDLSSDDSSIRVGKIEDVHHLLVSSYEISRLAAVTQVRPTQ